MCTYPSIFVCIIRFDLALDASDEDVAHWLLPRTGVVDAYVVADPESGEITDMFSFYHLPSTIIGHAKYDQLHAAYSFYNVPGKHTLEQIMKDALIMAVKVRNDTNAHAVHLQPCSHAAVCGSPHTGIPSYDGSCAHPSLCCCLCLRRSCVVVRYCRPPLLRSPCPISKTWTCTTVWT